MKYDVIAYCWNDALAGFTREDAQRLTHVNLAFGLLKDGLLDLHLLKYLHLLPRLRAWNPEMKIVLSVGGWGADGFSHMAMTEEGRRNFAKSCLDAVEKYNLDGIDIDWEYPCNDAAGIGADPRDKENFTALLDDGSRLPCDMAVLALGVAPEGGAAAGAQHRRGQGPHAEHGLLVADDVGGHDLPEQGHADKAEQAHEQEGPEGHPEHLALLVLPAQGVALRHRLGQGHGQARRGDGEEEGVDVKGPVEVAVGLLGEDCNQRDFEDGPDDLHQDGAHRQDGGGAVEGVAFGQQDWPPYLVWKSRGRA